MCDRRTWFSAADQQRIQQETFVATAQFHGELTSTNDHALQLAATESAQPPLLVVAGAQTAGRGRGSNRWWSAPGALTFSLLMNVADSCPAERRPLISLTAALAIGDALGHLLPPVEIGLKWPNDVYLAGRKVCGILVEVPAAPARHIVIGIGVNVNNSLSAAPDDVRRRATSLVDVAHCDFELADVLIAVLQRLAARWEQLAGDQLALVSLWRPYCLLTGRTVRLRYGDRIILGRCHGIDDQGALRLQTDQGHQRFFAGVVESFEP